MKAAYLTAVKKVELREIPAPTVERPGDVLLRIESIGMCGSDMHYYRSGRVGNQVIRFPWIPGHECSARVVEVGSGARRVQPGDLVAVEPLVACHHCDQCHGGHEHLCRNQKFLGCPDQLQGCLVEYITMPEQCCFKVPDRLDADRAALCEPLTIGLHAVHLAQRGSDTLPDGPLKVAILGSGPIGLTVLKVLQAYTPAVVYMTDLLDYRLDLARRSGAPWTGNPHKTDIVKEIAAAEKLGIDWVFDCAGEQETLDQAMEILKPAGKLVVVGIQEFERMTFLCDRIRRKEITVHGVRRQNACFPEAIECIASGKVNMDPLVTHHFPLDQVHEAFEMVGNYRDGVVKAMIQI